MSVLMETILGRLGSRFSLRFQPGEGQLQASPLGILYDRPINLEISMAAGETGLVWPFSPGERFSLCTQEITMTSLTYRCVPASLGVELLIKITAPFYPQDEKLSVAPFFYIDLLCRPVPGAKDRTAGEVKIGLSAHGDEAVTREGSGVLLQGKYRLSRDAGAEGPDRFSSKDFQGTIELVPIRGKMTLKETTFSIPYSADARTETRATFVLSAYCDEPVLDVGGAPHRFRYLRWFPSLGDVTAFAKDKEAEIVRKVEFFDDLFLRSSIGQSERNLIAYSFQSFLAATWWAESASGETDWFGCWDSGGFHNSMQSEYASSLFYLNLWPDLLEKQLNQRASLARGIGMLPANCGRFLSVEPLKGSVTGVEDACDYLLCMFAYWRWWNRFEPVEQNVSTMQMLGDFLLRSSSGRSGLLPENPSERDRIILKLLCALEALAIMAGEFDDADLSDSCSDALRDMKESLEKKGWPGSRNSVYVFDGLLLHLICDSFPELDYTLIRRSILSEDRGSSRVAISQSIRGDVIAAYLGISFVHMPERYWSAQVFANASGGPGGGYTDLAESRSLACDPRGAIAVGILQAAIGLKLDRAEQTLIVTPVSVPSKVPVLPLADWEARRAPWVTVTGEGGQIQVDVSERDLIQAMGEFVFDPHPNLKWGGS